MTRGRAGYGSTLLVVSGVVLLLVPLTVMLSTRSRGLTSLVRRSGHASSCEELAAMAIREGLRVLRLTANDPGEDAFTFFRATEAGGSLLVAAQKLERTASELAARTGYSLVGDVEVQLLRRSLSAPRPSERVAYEAEGVFRLRAEVTGPKGPGAVLVEEYGFRSALAAVPRPFDGATFFLGEPWPLLNEVVFQEPGSSQRGSANSTLHAAISRVHRYRWFVAEMADFFEGLAKEADEGLDSLPPFGFKKEKKLLKRTRKDARTLEKRYRRLLDEWPTRDWKLYSPAEPHDPTGAGALHLFGWPMAVYSAAQEIDLGKLNVPRRLQPLVDDLQAQVEPIELVVRRIQKELSSSNLHGWSAEPAEQFLGLIPDHLRTLDEMLTVYKDFQDALVEIGGPQEGEAPDGYWDSLRGHFTRLGHRAQERRAQFVFRGPGAARQAAEFLNRDPSPSGVVYVSDPEDELVVDLRDVEGRLVVVSEHAMRVVRATVRDPDPGSGDHVTLIGAGRLEVQAASGELMASVVAVGSEVDLGRSGLSSSLTGSLVIKQILGGDANAVLAGTLHRRPSAPGSNSGAADSLPLPAPETIHVALGPTPVYRRFE